MFLTNLGTYYESLLATEVRKEGGIYYTPPLIVDYMVAESIGKLLKNKTLKEAERIKIVDPSCGGGIFLLGAYQYLLDWYEKHLGTLTLFQRQQILTNNIFGIDIDPLAVEITKYSLLKKCNEGGEHSYELDKNICCGDFLLLDWQKEFPIVSQQDGFDIIIGNPPYIQLQKRNSTLANRYEHCGFETFERTGDIYCLFYERAWQLLQDEGLLCFVTSNKWMRAGYGESLRKFLSEKTNPILLLDLSGIKVFESSTVDVNILLYSKETNRHQTAVSAIAKITDLKRVKKNIKMSFSSAPWTVLKPMEQRIKEKIEAKGVPLKDWAIQINRGILTGYNSAFIVEEDVKNALIAEDPKSAEILKPLLNNHTITKYRIGTECRYLINSHNGDKSKNLLPIDLPKDYPAVHRYILHVLEQHKSGTNVRKRGHTGYNKDFYERTDQGITPFNLRHCAYLDKFESPKIVWKQTSAEKTFAFDDRNRFLDVTGQMLTSDTNDVLELKYILGILNSRLMDFYVRKSAMAFGVVGVRWIPQFIERLPFVRPDKSVLKKIETLVNKILLKKSEDEDTSVLERKIDALVYELYGLTQEEIAVIEKIG